MHQFIIHGSTYPSHDLLDNGALNDIITPRASEEAKQSSCKEKRIASVIKYMLNIRLFPKARLKNFLNYTHLREGNTVSQQRIIEVQVKVTEWITLLFCLYLRFLRVNPSQGQWREFKLILFPVSWSSDEGTEGVTNDRYSNRLRDWSCS